MSSLMIKRKDRPISKRWIFINAVQKKTQAMNITFHRSLECGGKRKDGSILKSQTWDN